VLERSADGTVRRAFTPDFYLPDVGLYLGGLSPCWPYVSHAAVPGHEARAAAVRRFYGEASPQERAALLEETGAALVVLPSGLPPGWLGPAAALDATPSARGNGLAAYRRPRATPGR
jgi:hypothetical protein